MTRRRAGLSDRGVRLAGAALLVLAAAACTGTFQPSVPLALLVVEGAVNAPSQVLGYAVDPPGPATSRAVRPLGVGTLTPEITGPIVDLDWLDRDEAGGGAGGGRSRVVMLVSQRATAPAGRSASLYGYDTAGFDLVAPSALQALGALTLDLVAGGAFTLGVAGNVQEPTAGVCLDALSVSRTGRYVALLDRRSACDPGIADTENFLLLIDTVEGELVWSTYADPVRGVAPVIDQANGRLEYVSGPEVRSAPLGDPGATETLGTLPITSLDTVRAFTRHGPDRLVIVNDALYRVEASGLVSGPVATESSALGFVETWTGLGVLVRTPARLVVHDTPADDERRVLARDYRGGSTDVVDQLTYLVRPGAVDTLDLLLYDPAAPNPIGSVVGQYPAPALADPRAITWFRPRPTIP